MIFLVSDGVMNPFAKAIQPPVKLGLIPGADTWFGALPQSFYLGRPKPSNLSARLQDGSVTIPEVLRPYMMGMEVPRDGPRASAFRAVARRRCVDAPRLELRRNGQVLEPKAHWAVAGDRFAEVLFISFYI